MACQPAVDMPSTQTGVNAATEQTVKAKVVTDTQVSAAPKSSAPTPNVETDNSFGYAHSSAELSVSEAFAQKQRDVLALGSSDRRLKITGLRYRDERSDPNMDLGTLRATAMRLRFEPFLPLEQLDISSELVDEAAPAQARMEAIRFEWVALTAPVPLIENATPIAFRYRSATPITTDQFPVLVAAFGQGGAQQRFEITGFYFDGENESLAQQRADALATAFANLHTRKVVYVKLAQFRGAKPANEPFEAASFRWID